MTNNKTLIAIVGPTAVGKTALSIAFAKAYNTEIISCDSRQLYKEMNIGTAVPSQQELAEVTHHFIQTKSIHTPYTVGDFEHEAMDCITTLFEVKDVVIMVGGSALFEKAVTHGLDDFPDVPDQITKDLTNDYNTKGIQALQQELLSIDPNYYNEVDLHNTQRLIRALAIYRHTGKQFSTLRQGKQKQRPFNILKIGLTAPRDLLYSRINDRVDQMMEQGLLNEVRGLIPYKDYKALKTVGYQEFMDYFDGLYDLNEAIRLVKRNSRRFAKRQLTWYRKEQLLWFDFDHDFDQIISHCDTLLDS